MTNEVVTSTAAPNKDPNKRNGNYVFKTVTQVACEAVREDAGFTRDEILRRAAKIIRKKLGISAKQSLDLADDVSSRYLVRRVAEVLDLSLIPVSARFQNWKTMEAKRDLALDSGDPDAATAIYERYLKNNDGLTPEASPGKFLGLGAKSAAAYVLPDQVPLVVREHWHRVKARWENGARESRVKFEYSCQKRNVPLVKAGLDAKALAAPGAN